MSPILSRNPLVEQVASGQAPPDLVAMLLARQLPLTEEEYLEALVYRLGSAQDKTAALRQLQTVSPQIKTQYAQKRQCDHRVAQYILLDGLNRRDLHTVAAVVHNQALPPEFLEKVAAHGNGEMLESLLDNQIKLIAYPHILELMAANPDATPFIQGRIREIRNDYLSPDPAQEIPAEVVTEELRDALTRDEAAAGEEAGEDLADLIEERTLTTLQRINQMSVSERIKLALTGTKTERMILIRDANKMVSHAVVESPKLTEDEVLLMVRNRSVAGDIIQKMASNRDWTKNYNIVVELVNNPKTPVKDALGFIKKLHDRDLRLLQANKNASPVIRGLALNFIRQRDRKKH